MADVLVALDGDARTLHEQKEAANFARTTYEITAQRYEAGGVSQLILLDAQRKQPSASLDEITAVAVRYADSAALFQRWAVAGGPYHRQRMFRRPEIHEVVTGQHGGGVEDPLAGPEIEELCTFASVAERI